MGIFAEKKIKIKFDKIKNTAVDDLTKAYLRVPLSSLYKLAGQSLLVYYFSFFSSHCWDLR